MPAGADTVAPADAIELRGASVYAVAPLAAGDGVLLAGTDAAPGDVVCRGGTCARASDLAALTALRVNQIQVCEPYIRVESAAVEQDDVIAAIMGLLARAVDAAGGVAATPPPGRGGLEDALGDTDADAVILIGGSGSGSRDRSVHALARRGRVAFHGVGLSPGETAAFGTIEQRPVLVVPGRLDAALAVWLMLGRRMVARLCGRDDDAEQATSVMLTRKIASTLGLAEIVPVMREAGGVAPLASGYLPPHALARADGYVIVPPDSEGYPAGARVEMRPLP
jgi:molybdopterin biosynthesis enzyme